MSNLIYLYTLFLFSTQIEDCILAILDATVDEEIVHNDVMEVDQNGHTPGQKNKFKPYPGGKSLFDCVAMYDLDVSKKMHN